MEGIVFFQNFWRVNKLFKWGRYTDRSILLVIYTWMVDPIKSLDPNDSQMVLNDARLALNALLEKNVLSSI